MTLESIRPLTLAAVAGFALALPGQRISDTIVKADGARVRGVEVTETSASTVKYKQSGKEQSLSADQVADIEWHDPPESFARASATAGRGDYKTAANLFTEAAGEIKRAPFQLEAKYLAARALLDGAETDTTLADLAATALRTYIGEAADGFREPHARLGLGRALRLKGDPAGAATALTELEGLVTAKGWSVIWAAKAKLERARALMAQGKAADARSAFQSADTTLGAALGSTDIDPAEIARLKTAAVIGQGETFVADKQFDQALQFFRRYTGQPNTGQDTAMQAAALAGEGQALYLKAAGAKDVAGLRRAQVSLAKANILDVTNDATTAKALFYSGQVLLALGSEKEKESKARARAYFESVVRHYRGTPWSATAKAALDKL